MSRAKHPSQFKPRKWPQRVPEMIQMAANGYTLAEVAAHFGESIYATGGAAKRFRVSFRSPTGEAVEPVSDAPRPTPDERFVSAIFQAHPLGYLGPWYDKKREAA